MAGFEAPRDTELGAERLKRFLWSALTFDDDPTSRHAINNLIVPLVLNGERSTHDGPEPDHKFALGVMLRILGRMADRRSEDNENRKANNTHKIILVDDQAHHGWEHWVRSILLRCDDKGFQTMNPSQFFANILTGSRGLAQATILLDLRLGTAIQADAKRELLANRDRWLERARPLGSAITSALNRDLNTLARLTLLANLSPANSIRLETILTTLFARLVAIAQPRTPIIIFSSTQNADILKRLGLFPNAIMGFSKGTVGQTVDESFRIQTTTSLLRCITEAESMHRVVAAASFAEQPKDNAGSANQIAAIHVELYADESGQSPMAVGGVVAVFSGKTTTTAVEKAHRFNRSFLKELRPFDFGTDRSIEKGSSIAGHFASLLKKDPDAPSIVSKIQLTGNQDQKILMTCLVEGFVGLVLPAVKDTLGVHSMTFSVFLPKRSVPAGKISNPKGSEYPYRFGIGSGATNQGGMLLYLVGDDFASNIVREAITRTARSDDKPNLDQALTVSLAYAPDYEAHHEPTPVKAVIHHGRKRREWVRLTAGSRQERERERVALETEYQEKGWEPDCRGLHYVADMVVGGDKCAKTKCWSFNDHLNTETMEILRAVQVINHSKHPTKSRTLGRVLNKIANEASDTNKTPRSLARLALRNLYHTVGSDWKKVVNTALREASRS